MELSESPVNRSTHRPGSAQSKPKPTSPARTDCLLGLGLALSAGTVRWTQQARPTFIAQTLRRVLFLLRGQEYAESYKPQT